MADATTVPGHWETDAATWEALEAGEVLSNTVKAEDEAREVHLEAVFPCSARQLRETFSDYDQLPALIAGLQDATVLERDAAAAARVRFAMKLPFPIGRLSWVNDLDYIDNGDYQSIQWRLVEGDFHENQGHISMRDIEGGRCHAKYRLRISTKIPLPAFAERLGFRWLLPRVLKKLRRKIADTNNNG